MTAGSIGFIGLGNMGSRMATCILANGHEVIGYDVRPDVVAATGVTPASSIAAVVTTADVVLVSLPDSKVVESVVLGEDGIRAHVRDGQVVVDLSTAAPASTRRIHDLLAEHGAEYIDIGVSGGAAAAEEGALTLMVGGSESALAAVRGVLEKFSAHIFYCGGSGAGHVTKLLNNFLNAVSLSATAEVMIAGKKAGLNLQTLLDVINVSSGVNFATTNRFPKIITGDYLQGGLTNTLMLKDITLYAELVSELGVASLNAPGPIAAFGLARSLGYSDKISNTVVDAIGDLSGGVRLHTPEVNAA